MRRRLLWSLVPALLVLSPLILAALAVETRPLVRDTGPPDARAVEQTRDVIDRVRLVVSSSGAVADIAATEAQINGVLAAVQRVARGVEGRAQLAQGRAEFAFSVGAPLMPPGLWLNLRGALAGSEEGIEVVSARVGRVPVPPGLVLFAARRGLDHLLGDGLGREVLASLGRIEVTPPMLSVSLAGDPARRAAFFERLKARSPGTGAGMRTAVYDQLRLMRKAVRRGDLPRQGSLVPHVEAVVRFAGRGEAAGPEAMRAALYALALACGHSAFGEVVGVEPGWEALTAAGCDEATLAGRDDLKRHFALSAGLYAATTSGRVAFGVGELKELLDSAESEGFSFEDIAADAAGVRFAKGFLAAPAEDWPGMLEEIRGEADLMPSLDGLAEGMDATAFHARFGGMDSPQYAAVIEEIDQRVAALPLYALPATN